VKTPNQLRDEAARIEREAAITVAQLRLIARRMEEELKAAGGGAQP